MASDAVALVFVAVAALAFVVAAVSAAVGALAAAAVSVALALALAALASVLVLFNWFGFSSFLMFNYTNLINIFQLSTQDKFRINTKGRKKCRIFNMSFKGWLLTHIKRVS
ncbi:hypothetical protein M3234_11385 [Neobacillus niacini]|nr:hypothetical protein [Neobacillus niacini]MCM3765554.1 hypothetical protein [Neobacillus niacini]